MKTECTITCPVLPGLGAISPPSDPVQVNQMDGLYIAWFSYKLKCSLCSGWCVNQCRYINHRVRILLGEWTNSNWSKSGNIVAMYNVIIKKYKILNKSFTQTNHFTSIKNSNNGQTWVILKVFCLLISQLFYCREQNMKEKCWQHEHKWWRWYVWMSSRYIVMFHLTDRTWQFHFS